MMKQLATGFFLVIFGVMASAQDSVRISGRVTDFNQQPIGDVAVRLKNEKFEDVYEAITDKNGNYQMTVLKNAYYCIYAIKLADYGKTKLEYWAWNIPAFTDLEINPRYERMEIYGVNAFEPQVSPQETYMVYFRPMSLTKSLALQGNGTKKEVEQKAMSNKNVIDIAPQTISNDELSVQINHLKSEVVSINKVTEYARGALLYGYLIQIKKPANNKPIYSDYDQISIILHSKETNEYGMGECFVKR